MRAIWTDENKLDLWLQIEVHTSEALVKEKIIPKVDLSRIKAGVKLCASDLPRLVRRPKKLERRLNHEIGRASGRERV